MTSTPLTPELIVEMFDDASDGCRPYGAIARQISEGVAALILDNETLRAEISTLYAALKGRDIELRGRDDALDEITTHATTTAAANDLIRRDRDTIRDAAMAREAALTRLAETISQRAQYAGEQSVRSAYLWCAEELTAVLTGGGS